MPDAPDPKLKPPLPVRPTIAFAPSKPVVPGAPPAAATRPDQQIKFPVRPVNVAPSLVLPRRRKITRSPFEVAEASAEARKQIANIVSATRTPWGGGKQLNEDQLSTLERSLRELEKKLGEREHAAQELETQLTERERDLSEAEALITAREKLIEASSHNSPNRTSVSKEELAALEQLKAELDRQEGALREQKSALAERERFMEENETKLFEKIMGQQEKETELEQLEEDLRDRAKALQAREAILDPQAAASLKEESNKAKKFDEFNE